VLYYIILQYYIILYTILYCIILYCIVVISLNEPYISFLFNMKQRDKQNLTRIVGKNRNQRNATKNFHNRVEGQLQITTIFLKLQETILYST